MKRRYARANIEPQPWSYIMHQAEFCIILHAIEEGFLYILFLYRLLSEILPIQRGRIKIWEVV
jgi:hypothetical protein